MALLRFRLAASILLPPQMSKTGRSGYLQNGLESYDITYCEKHGVRDMRRPTGEKMGDIEIMRMQA